MFSGLHDVDWASMHHAYGSAAEVPALLEALRSADAGERGEALSSFYGSVHHQGDVYPCTVASLPFLLELARDPATPDRGEIVGLMVSIGEVAVERRGADYVGSDHTGAAVFCRAHAEAFAVLAGDAECRVRQAAIPALALFIDDADRAFGLLRERSAMRFCLRERLAVTRATSTLAQRFPAIVPAATAWLGGLGGEPEFRLAALVDRARCDPGAIGDELGSAAVGLLREIAEAAPPEQPWPEPPPTGAQAAGVPPFVAAAFEDLERQQWRYSLTTEPLKTLHELLGARVPQRTALLTEQLRSPRPGVRLDAIRMTSELVRRWRGDHGGLIRLVAGQLGGDNLEVAAEAAELLDRHHALAGPARETLAAAVEGWGPESWASPRPHLRRAFQKAVKALARLGDERALPGLLHAFDTGADVWLAVQVAGELPAAADRLVPRLCGADRSQESTARNILAALGKLGDPAGLPAIVEALADPARAMAALEALPAFGPAAGSAAGSGLAGVRALVDVEDTWTRAAAVTALWAVGSDAGEVVPLGAGGPASTSWAASSGWARRPPRRCRW